jgi:hypothetical protein
MAFWLPLIAGASALSGFLQKKPKMETNSSSTTNSNTNIDQYNLPTLEPDQQAIRGTLLNAFNNRLNSSMDFSGYAANGLTNINQGSDIQRRITENILKSRGIFGRSAGASAIADVEGNRVSQGVGFLNQIPLLQDQRNRENTNDFAKYLSSLPTGNRTVGGTTTNGSQQTSGTQTGTGQGGIQGGFNGLAETLAYFAGKGLLGGKGNNPYGQS